MPRGCAVENNLTPCLKTHWVKCLDIFGGIHHLILPGGWQNPFCCLGAQSYPTLCDLMDFSTSLSFTISQSLLKLMSVESMMPSNHLILCRPLPLLPSIFPRIRDQGLFQWVSSLHQVAKVLELQHQSFQWIFWGIFLLGLTALISLMSKGLSRVFSSTTIWKHQFLALSLLYGQTLTSIHDNWKNHSFD